MIFLIKETSINKTSINKILSCQRRLATSLLCLSLTYILLGFQPVNAENKDIQSTDNQHKVHLVLDGTPDNPHDPYSIPLKKLRILPEQQIVGIGQFSKKNLEDLIIQLKPYQPENITIVDLRLETHFFISDLPVTLYGPKNQSNINKSPEEISQEENEHVAYYLQKIRTGEKSISLSRILKKNRGVITELTPPERLRLTSAYTEETLAQDLGLSYQRFWVMDHYYPNAKTINHIVDFISTLPTDEWLIVHCRGGAGRTTTFMMITSILRDTEHTPLDILMSAQLAEKGSNLLPNTDEKDQSGDWLAEAKNARGGFLRDFYTYRWAADGYGKQSWSRWSQARGKS